MSSNRFYQRLKPRLRQLLQSPAWNLDFGLYRKLNRRCPQFEHYLDVELPRLVNERTASDRQACDAYEVLGQFAADALAAELPFHVHCTSPLPEYAFRLSDGRRVVFERIASEQNASSASRFVLTERKPWTHDRNELRLRFEFCPTSPATKQKTVDAQTSAIVLNAPKLAGWHSALAHRQADSRGSVLQHHLAEFTSWHERDLVIRRDVAQHLGRRLDQLMIERWLALERWASIKDDEIAESVALARLTREIGRQLIAWLAEREQAMEQLWRQPPCIAQSEYCATLDRVPRNCGRPLPLTAGNAKPGANGSASNRRRTR